MKVVIGCSMKYRDLVRDTMKRMLGLGYAIAKDKPIYFSECTNDMGLDCYVNDFILSNEVSKFSKL